MTGYKDAPLISLNDKSDTTDTYAFVENNGFGGQGAGTGLGFGIGDTDGDTNAPEDTSLSSFYDVFMTLNNRTELVASLNADGANGSLSIGSAGAPLTIDFDDVADPDGTSDALFL